MPSRAIKQPNGLYARFHTIVDDFTHYNHIRDELWIVFRDESGVDVATEKMQRADDNLDRFEEALNIIKIKHGDKIANDRRKELSEN